MIAASVIIVTYKEETELFNCLESLFKSHRPTKSQPIEVIVADNNSRSKLQTKLKQRFPEVVYFKTGSNLGFGPANNRGADRAQGQYLFFLNPDTTVEPGVISELIQFLDGHRRAAVAAPTLFDMTGHRYDKQGSGELTPLTALAAHSIIHRLWPNNPVAQHFWQPAANLKKPRQIPVIPGTALMVRRRAFEAIQGFDEQFFIYFEEHDLCRRFRAQGWQIWQVPQARIRHIWHAATQGAEYNQIYRQSRFKYFQKYYGVWTAKVVEAFLNVGKKTFFSYSLFTQLLNR